MPDQPTSKSAFGNANTWQEAAWPLFSPFEQVIAHYSGLNYDAERMSHELFEDKMRVVRTRFAIQRHNKDRGACNYVPFADMRSPEIDELRAAFTPGIEDVMRVRALRPLQRQVFELMAQGMTMEAAGEQAYGYPVEMLGIIELARDTLKVKTLTQLKELMAVVMRPAPVLVVDNPDNAR